MKSLTIDHSTDLAFGNFRAKDDSTTSGTFLVSRELLKQNILYRFSLDDKSMINNLRLHRNTVDYPDGSAGCKVKRLHRKDAMTLRSQGIYKRGETFLFMEIMLAITLNKPST
jgi:hypothetical protein